MNRGKLIRLVGIAGLLLLAALALPLSGIKAGHHEHGKHKAEDEGFDMDRLYSEQLPAIQKAIDEAVKAVNADDKKAALKQLEKAKKTVTEIQNAVGEHVKPAFVNARCPIMGTPINPDKVSESLKRQYKGQKVAFCCAGCPRRWDKLSDADKQTKLEKAKAK